MGKEILPPGVSSVVATPPPTREKPPETTADRYGKWRKETEQREASCPHGLKRLATAILGNWLGRIGLGLGVATVVGVAYEAVPAIHKTVDNLTGQGELIVPDTFDPTAKEGVIGANNSIVVTAEQYEQMQKDGTAPPTIDAENKRFNIPLAIRFKDGKVRPLRYKWYPGYRQAGEPNDTVSVDGLQEGDTLLSPMDGKLTFGATVLEKDGSWLISGLSIEPLNRERDGAHIGYLTTWLKPLINAPTATGVKEGIGKPVEIKRGQPIAVLTTSEREPHAEGGQIAITSLLGPEHEVLVKKAGGRIDITLPNIPDGKVIMLQ